jgi:hypothetical protein
MSSDSEPIERTIVESDGFIHRQGEQGLTTDGSLGSVSEKSLIC